MTYQTAKAKPPYPILNRAHPLARGLRICYPFCERFNPTSGGGSTLRDVSGNGFHANPEGGGSIATSPWGYASDHGFVSATDTLRFDTTWAESFANYSHCAVARYPTAATSFEMMMYKRGTGAGVGNIRNGTGANAGSHHDGGSYVPIVNGEWHNFVGRFDGSTLETIRDGGKEYASSSRSGTMGDGVMDIGRDPGGGLEFDGMVAFVAWWNRVLTNGEVDMLVVDPWTFLRGTTRTVVGFVPAPGAAYFDGIIAARHRPFIERNLRMKTPERVEV